MSFEIIATEPFARKLKKLAKKYKSIANDLSVMFDELAQNPEMGTPLGKDCYKIRLAITSKGKGKSGGARIITYVRVIKNTIYLMDIYDKSEQSTITDKDLQFLIDILGKD
jgi:mRNA-degrading endonuclease RelE of RelBE toxin-antitoxin system